MMPPTLPLTSFLVFSITFATAISFAAVPEDWLIVPGKRVGQITSNSTEASLKKTYGEQNVKPHEVYIGEGDTVKGTVLFPDIPSKRLEIIWIDAPKRQYPSRVQLTGKKSHWKTQDGISLGTSLIRVEKINSKPFSLTGFDWDFSGTVISWNSGKLEKPFNTNGKVYLRFSKPQQIELSSEQDMSVSGDREFSSKFPLMQKINPEIYQIVVEFK